MAEELTKATAACRVQVKCETYYFICYRCPRRRRHFSSAGTRNQAETTKGSAQQKLNTLRQLATEILAIVAEEEIEIERADLLEQNVQLVIAEEEIEGEIERADLLKENFQLVIAESRVFKCKKRSVRVGKHVSK